MWLLYVLSAFVGYLLGSIPTGYLVGRRYGIDIREHGSGNIGATNVVRVLGKRPGYLVFACDLLKGLLAVRTADLIVRAGGRAAYERVIGGMGAVDPASLQPSLEKFAAQVGTAATLAAIVAALGCILGHNFPVWLRFRGGKGVATTVGVVLGLMPLAFLVAAVVWLVAFYATRFVSLASMVAVTALPVAVWWLTPHGRGAATHGFGPMFWFSVVAAGLVFLRHRANIGRLLNGTEPRFARKAKTPVDSVPPPP